jgi:hypothetical protein
MADIRVAVRNGLGGNLLLDNTSFQRDRLVQQLSAALGSRPSRPIVLMHDGKIIEADFQAATEDFIELTCIRGQPLEEDVRAQLLQLIDDAAARRPAAQLDLFQSFPEAARDDPEIVLKAVKQNPRCLEFASEACRDDRGIVLAAVRWPECLRHAGTACCNDRNIVLAAVDWNPRCLQYAGAACRDDEEIVMRAVTKNPWCLEYAGDRCANNKNIVLKAVQGHSRCLQFASADCKADAIIRQAVSVQECDLQNTGKTFRRRYVASTSHLATEAKCEVAAESERPGLCPGPVAFMLLANCVLMGVVFLNNFPL